MELVHLSTRRRSWAADGSCALGDVIFGGVEVRRGGGGFRGVKAGVQPLQWLPFVFCIFFFGGGVGGLGVRSSRF